MLRSSKNKSINNVEKFYSLSSKNLIFSLFSKKKGFNREPKFLSKNYH